MKFFSNKKYLGFLSLFSLLSANATETYLCMAKSSTGFKANDGYRVVNFKPDNKWLIKKQSETAWSVNKFGEDVTFDSSMCPFTPGPNRNKGGARDFLLCQNHIQSFDFDRSSKKYQYYWKGGYVHNFFEGDDVYLEIGTCQKI